MITTAIDRPLGVPLPPAIGDGPASRRRASRPRAERVEPNYALRRLGAVVVLGLVACIVAVVLNGLLASLGGVPASAAEARPAAPSAGVHVAAPGDTLWSIAARYRGDVGHERYLDALIRLNGGTSILAGQAIRLP